MMNKLIERIGLSNMNSKKVFWGLLSPVAIILSILIVSQAIFAQQPDRGFQAANSYAATGLEIVNTTNGNLVMNIPIASLPTGRGGSLGYTIGLQYNSKLWDSQQTNRDDGYPGENSNSYYSVTTLNLSPRGGWKFNAGYSLQVYDRLNFQTPNVCHLNDPVEHLAFRWKVEMEMPDGSVKQFFPETGRSYEVGMNNDGYANIDPNGTVFTATQGQHPGTGICITNQDTYQYTTNGMTYITMDGSRLRLFVPYQPSVQPNLKNWKLYAPSGTVIENYPSDNSTVAQRTTDRNGNVVEAKTDGKITDQLGRSIEFSNASNGDFVISVKGVGGETVETKLRWGSQWVQKKYRKSTAQNAAENHRYDTVSQNIQTLEKIIFPTQLGTQSMDFEYNGLATQPGANQYSDGWGEIKKITLPTGAYSEYEFDDNGQGDETTAEEILERFVANKELKYSEQYDGNQPVNRTDTWLYNVSRFANGVTSPSGAVNSEYLNYNTSGISSWDSGLSYKSVNPDGSMTERLWAYNLPYTIPGTVPNVPGGFSGVGSANSYVKAEFTTVSDAAGNPSLTAIKEYKHDKNGNVLEIKEYDWVSYSSVPRSGTGVFSKVTGLPTSGLVLKRKTINTYYNQAADADSQTANSNSYSDPASPKLKNVIKSTEIQDGNGTPVSRSEFFYDDPNNKGNLIETKTWDSYKGGSSQSYSNPLTSTNSISVSTVYDSYGNPTQTTDANGIQTTITYGCVGGQTSCASTEQNLYPTKIETASNYSSLKRTVTTQYDFHTGLGTLTTDADNNISTATTYDALGRPTKVAAAYNTSSEFWTQMVYDDVNRKVISKADVSVKGDAKRVSIQHFDQLGRVRLSRTLEDSDTEDPDDETDGIKVQTRYLTTNGFSYQLSSNPYRADYSTNAGSEESMGWTRSKTENTGRHSEIETFSGANLPTPFVSSGANTNSTGVVKTDLDAERTLVTDQAGKQRISKMNGLGQMTDVWEIVSASDSSTVSVTFPNQSGIAYGYQTSYQYDTLNNLTTVNQGSQTRTFTYSSLSRLLSANNPESGTISYKFDNNGNLTQKTDARNITTDYVYDALNRVTQRNYSDSTPDVTYTYDDTNISNSKGKLTKVDNGFSKSEYTQFDLLGRVTKSKQTTDGTAYNEMEYVYNLSGALIEQKYPSGQVVKNVLDNEGELKTVKGKKNANSAYWNYADHFTYTASGTVSSMQLGNGTWESTQFNSRLQPTQIALGKTQGTSNLLDLDFAYGTTANNGNVQSQTITVPTVGSNNGFTATQTYAYDSLNRIKDATETISNNQTWKQTFQYDRFSNRNFDEANTTTLPKNCTNNAIPVICAADRKVMNPSISTNTNRIVLDQDNDNQNDYTFDNSGNTTKDATSRTFIYDAENKQIEVKNSTNQTIGQYWYDGDGKRVKKKGWINNQWQETIFLFDASGKLVEEYSTIVVSLQSAKVGYLTTDLLGSPRINTNESGTVTARHDYHPFGEEVFRSSYGNDDVRKKFTGYERDEETNLDFAQARYYSNQFGRFTSTDPIFIKINRLVDPQKLNLYVYVRNNPLKFVDITGEDLILANQRARDNIDSLFSGLTAEERSRIIVDANGKVSILENDLNPSNCMRCNQRTSTTFQMISEAVSSNFDIRISIINPGETATLMEPVPDAQNPNQVLTSFSYNDLVNRAGVAVPYSNNSWDIFLPSGGSDVEDIYGSLIPTNLITMTPHEIAHPLNYDAVDIENKVRDENQLPRRSGNDHFDPRHKRPVLTTGGPQLVPPPNDTTIQRTITPRPLLPLPTRPNQ